MDGWMIKDELAAPELTRQLDPPLEPAIRIDNHLRGIPVLSFPSTCVLSVCHHRISPATTRPALKHFQNLSLERRHQRHMEKSLHALQPTWTLRSFLPVLILISSWTSPVVFGFCLSVALCRSSLLLHLPPELCSWVSFFFKYRDSVSVVFTACFRRSQVAKKSRRNQCGENNGAREPEWHRKYHMLTAIH